MFLNTLENNIYIAIQNSKFIRILRFWQKAISGSLGTSLFVNLLCWINKKIHFNLRKIVSFVLIVLILTNLAYFHQEVSISGWILNILLIIILFVVLLRKDEKGKEAFFSKLINKILAK